MSQMNNSSDDTLKKQYQTESADLVPADALNKAILSEAKAAVDGDRKPIWSWPLTPVGGFAAVLFVGILYFYQPYQGAMQPLSIQSMPAPSMSEQSALHELAEIRQQSNLSELEHADSDGALLDRVVQENSVQESRAQEQTTKPETSVVGQSSLFVESDAFEAKGVLMQKKSPLKKALPRRSDVIDDSASLAEALVTSQVNRSMAEIQGLDIKKKQRYPRAEKKLDSGKIDHFKDDVVAQKLILSDEVESESALVEQRQRNKVGRNEVKVKEEFISEIDTASFSSGMLNKVKPFSLSEMTTSQEVSLSASSEIPAAADKISDDKIGPSLDTSVSTLVFGTKVERVKTATAYIRAITLADAANTVTIKGDHANPCSLGLLVFQQVDGDRIILAVKDQFDTAVMCIQMLQSFDIELDFSALPAGKYQIVIEGNSRLKQMIKIHE